MADDRAFYAVTPTSVTFFSDLSDESIKTGNTLRNPELRSISFENGKLIERRWAGTATGTALSPTYSYTYPATPAQTRVLADDISAVDKTVDGQPLIFHFYYYRDADSNPATPPVLDGEYDSRSALTRGAGHGDHQGRGGVPRQPRPRQGHRPRPDGLPQHGLLAPGGPEQSPQPESGVRMTPTRPDLRAQSGFSMFLVIMAMFLTSMFIAAAFAAANGDLPVSGDSKNRKSTYAAAEAGLNFYLNHLQQDNDYWTLCDQVPAPNATEVNPVNQQWDGTDPSTDTRRWRTIPGSTAQYTIEILHNAGFTKCETDPTSRIGDRPGDRHVQDPRDRASVDRLRRSGARSSRRSAARASSTSSTSPTSRTRPAGDSHELRAHRADELRRQVPRGTRRQGLHRDPVRHGRRDQRSAAHQRRQPPDVRDAGVRRKVRTAASTSRPIEVSGPSPGYVRNTGCSGDPRRRRRQDHATAKQLSMPTSNDQLEDVAAAGGTRLLGQDGRPSQDGA